MCHSRLAVTSAVRTAVSAVQNAFDQKPAQSDVDFKAER